MRPKLRQMLQKPSQSSAAGNNPGKHIDWDFSIQTDSLVVTLVRGSRDGFFLHNEESAWHIEETSGDVVVEKPALMQLICPPDCDFDADGRQDWLEKVIAEGVRSHAKAQLLPRLLALSGLYGFQKNLKEVKINSSKGRWGSCVEHKSPGLLRRSSSFNINLSLFTLLLPLPVQKLILLHELTHIHHMDHSEAFHRELDGMLQGQEQALEKELKHYDTNIFSFV